MPVVPQMYHTVSSAAPKSHHTVRFKVGPCCPRSSSQGLGHIHTLDITHLLSWSHWKTPLFTLCTQTSFATRMVQLFQFRLFHLPPLQTSFSVSLTRTTLLSFQEPSHTQQGERKARSPWNTGWEPSSASRIYLSNAFSTYCLCFSMKIQLSCQTHIINDSVFLYKKSVILCNSAVYSSQIYVRFQDYFLILTFFSGNRRLKKKDTCMWESVDTLMQITIKRLLGERKCHTSF